MDANRNNEYDTKKILEQMRDEYWRGLSETEAEEARDLDQIVTILLGDELFAVNAVQSKEILKVPPLVRVPRTPDSVLGIFNLRGKITSVIDIRPMLGLKTPDLGPRARVVLVDTGAISSGLIVEDVREITNVPRSSIVPVVRTISRKDCLAGQTDLNGQILVFLDMDKILNSPEFKVNV